MAVVWQPKGAGETKTYELDWSDGLDANDTIAASTFTFVTQAGLGPLATQGKTNTTSTVELTGGTAGLNAVLKCEITTAGGDTLDETISLDIIFDVPALIVEDGTALSTAESYTSAAFASLYHAKRGNAAWGALASDALREGYLRQATDYMLQVYRLRWLGYRTNITQALDWPRYQVPMKDIISGYCDGAPMLASNIVPVEVQNACAELALRAVAGSLFPDETQAIKSRTVGPISTVYQDFSTSTRTYRSIDRLLAPYLQAQGGISVGRA